MKKVLVVDDYVGMRRMMKEFLEIEEFQVQTASDGLEALNVVKGWHPDLIIMDINMPHLNGIEVCKVLKGSATTRQIPIVLISTMDEDQIDEKIREAGADRFLSKPFGFHDILELAHSYS